MAVIDSESETVYTEIRRTGAAIATYVFIPPPPPPPGTFFP